LVHLRHDLVGHLAEEYAQRGLFGVDELEDRTDQQWRGIATRYDKYALTTTPGELTDTP
jgi:hypothetical protein